MIDIDKIALEVARSIKPKNWYDNEYTVDFAKAFLARVDQERAKAGAVGYVAHGSTMPKNERVFAGCAILNSDEASEYLPECITPLYLSPTLPIGWKAVPVEPTKEMITEYIMSPAYSPVSQYKAMLAAAPEVPK